MGRLMTECQCLSVTRVDSLSHDPNPPASATPFIDLSALPCSPSQSETPADQMWMIRSHSSARRDVEYEQSTLAPPGTAGSIICALHSDLHISTACAVARECARSTIQPRRKCCDGYGYPCDRTISPCLACLTCMCRSRGGSRSCRPRRYQLSPARTANNLIAYELAELTGRSHA